MKATRTEAVLWLLAAVVLLAMGVRVILADDPPTGMFNDGMQGSAGATCSDSRFCQCNYTTSNCTPYNPDDCKPPNDSSATFVCPPPQNSVATKGVKLLTGRRIGALSPQMGGQANLEYWDPLQCAWLKYYYDPHCSEDPPTTFLCYKLIKIYGTEGCIPGP